MSAPFSLEADPARLSAVAAVGDLLSRLRIVHAFVGEVAHAVWLGRQFTRGAVDVLALMSPESKSQVPMMAGNRGFAVDRAEVEAADQLDLIPLSFPHASAVVRCHVLLASNALYAHMVGAAHVTSMGDRTIRVVKADDLALIDLVGGAPDASDTVERLLKVAGGVAPVDGVAFDRQSWNARLRSIGVRAGVPS